MSNPVKYKKKPVVIEAMQWDGSLENAIEILNWCGGRWTAENPQRLKIETLEGDMIASPGWWIIKGVKGEFYPCEPEIFGMTYEAASDDESH